MYVFYRLSYITYGEHTYGETWGKIREVKIFSVSFPLSHAPMYYRTETIAEPHPGDQLNIRYGNLWNFFCTIWQSHILQKFQCFLVYLFTISVYSLSLIYQFINILIYLCLIYFIYFISSYTRLSENKFKETKRTGLHVLTMTTVNERWVYYDYPSQLYNLFLIHFLVSVFQLGILPLLFYHNAIYNDHNFISTIDVEVI